ncbi:MAG: hypothetical protein HQ478_06625, partial [Chloroflexi bacterium]|nr:hypothetical protein [Chloroflexota bacterium]
EANETDPKVADTDGDGLMDGEEDRNKNGVVEANETDPKVADTDGDGLKDGEEDTNKNGLVDANETDPLNPDTDGDAITDGQEVLDGTDPLVSNVVLVDVSPLFDEILAALALIQARLDVIEGNQSTTTPELLSQHDQDIRAALDAALLLLTGGQANLDQAIQDALNSILGEIIVLPTAGEVQAEFDSVDLQLQGILNALAALASDPLPPASQESVNEMRSFIQAMSDVLDAVAGQTALIPGLVTQVSALQDDESNLAAAIQQATQTLLGGIVVLPTSAEVQQEFDDIDGALQQALDALTSLSGTASSTQSDISELRSFLLGTQDVVDTIAAQTALLPDIDAQLEALGATLLVLPTLVSEHASSTQFMIDSFFDIFTELDALNSSVQTRASEATAQLIRDDIAAQQFSIDSFFDIFVELAIDARFDNIDAALAAQQASIDSFFDVFIELSALDTAIGTRASQASVDALASAVATNQRAIINSFFDISTDLAAVHNSVNTRASQESVDAFAAAFDAARIATVDSFIEVIVELDDVDSRIGTRASQASLDQLSSDLLSLQSSSAADLNGITNQITLLSNAVANAAQQSTLNDLSTNVDANQTIIIDSFFDVFTELSGISGTLSSLATQTSVDALAQAVTDSQTFAEGSFFDIFTELSALDIAVGTRASQDSLDALALSTAENQTFNVDSFFDVFTELGDLGTRIDSRASQASVDALALALADGQQFAVDSFSDVFAGLEAITSTSDSAIKINVIELKERRRFLVTTSFAGTRRDVTLQSVLALDTDHDRPATIEDVTAEVEITPVAPGVIDVRFDLPRSVREADVFIFDVIDSEGFSGTAIFTRHHDN